MQGDGKTVLVTGASRGIGRGIALTMARNGYDVFFNHWKDDQNAAAVAEEIRTKYGRKAALVNLDLTEPGAPERLVEMAIAEMGRLDVVVNNAGVTIFGNIQQMSEEQMNTLYRLNFLAPMLVTGAASKHMAEQGIAGSIINIASSRGERAYPGDAVYGGLKAALRRATESLALELAPYGIRVNAIAPGAIQTVPGREASYAELGKKIPLERVGTPEDIGEAAVWLSSPQASYITGITLRIDGGLILPGMPEGGPGAGEYGWGRPDWTKK